MPRLGHKKSRLGCRQCKARHVKCDELKPCSNCARHGVPCSLVAWDPNIPQPPVSASSAGTTPQRTNQPPHERPIAGTSSSSTPPSRHDYTIGQPAADPRVPRAVSSVSERSSSDSQPDLYPFLSKFIHRAEITQADIWLRDLELLHYWTTEAYDELSQRDDMRHTWRVEAPKHAVRHAFFMHEILAFAAFHRAHKEQNEQRREYYTFGVHHQDLAIRGVRQRLHNVTPQEAAAIVATSTLLTLSVFASSGFEAECAATDSPQDAVDGILNCFYLMQGMGNVLAMAQATVRDSFLAPMFKDPVDVIPSQPMLEELMQHIPTLENFIRGKRDLPEDERKLYLKTVAFFQPVLGMSVPPKVDNRELRFLFFWPLHLDAEYMSLVRQRHSGALVILMYYTTILLASEPRYWFLDGWGRRLMQSCYDAVDQSWISAIQWPLSFLNQNVTWDLFANLSQHQQSPGLPRGIMYPQRQTIVIPHRQTPPGPFTSAEDSARSYDQRAFALQMGEEDQKPVVRMGSSSVGQAPSPDTN